MRYIACLLQHLPSLFVLTAVVSSFVFGTKLSTIPFVLFGTYSAWVYLRFLQLKPDMSIRCALSHHDMLLRWYAHLSFLRGKVPNLSGAGAA